jgi:hypothetical protein
MRKKSRIISGIVLGLAFLFANPTLAQVQTGQRVLREFNTYTLYKGGASGVIVGEYKDWATCNKDAAAARNYGTNVPPNGGAIVEYLCLWRHSWQTVYPPKPPLETKTTSCPAGYVGSYPQTRHYYGTDVGPNYWIPTLWEPLAPPAGACTAIPPQPAPITQTASCPAGSVGSYTQSQAYISAPAPTFWVLSGVWSPNSAPVGACTVIPPQPAAITQTAQCPAGQYGSYTQSQVYVSAPAPTFWALSGVWTPNVAPTGACIVIPAQPADITQTAQCPAGQYGSYTQTQSYVSAPAPTFWALSGTWTPSVAPAGACIVIPTQPAPITQTVACPAGTSGTWIQTQPYVAAPAPTFWALSGTWSPATPPATSCPAIVRNATLSWTPPTQNTDGTALTNLAGYNIYYGISAASLTNKITINNPATTSYVVTLPAAGTYYFAMTAYNSAVPVEESVQSNVGNKVFTQ